MTNISDQGYVSGLPPVETFTLEEESFLRRYVTNVDKPVFALINLPEVVKGALFARYSRSSKSLRRLLLDEFRADLIDVEMRSNDRHVRAEQFYSRVFQEYGDDSVAQLGGVHVACEGASNILTKVLERGRLMSYLEQSTRYIPYDDQVGGRWRYHIPAELDAGARDRFVSELDAAFEGYVRLIPPLEAFFAGRYRKPEQMSDAAFNRSVKAKALDTLRGLLPAATRSNLGIYGSGQGFESLLLRMRASTNTETQSYAALLLHELRQVIPSFVARVDRPDRGIVWTSYLRETRSAVRETVDSVLHPGLSRAGEEVRLADFDPEGEVKVVAAALYADSHLSDEQLLAKARDMSRRERKAVIDAYVGDRSNRRHRPGRAFERTMYRFDVTTDYGAFRDLQRHRMMTIDWQRLTPQHGYDVPAAIEEAGYAQEWHSIMEASSELHRYLFRAGYEEAAPYAVSMAYRIRFSMEMNAREAMHLIELRTAPQGHPSYRRVCQQMHELIRRDANHVAIADSMRFVDYEEVELERAQAEAVRDTRNGNTNAD